ncbi:hypothetical protein pdam_00012741 [Pocillopora damicornis]|uniref:Uncharacterized protein n=1 Tax=Pocillopora damicornis TaxID=46731 RepID=A0A3M6TTM0_POCDA|nr:hypothetical protein pdam_00012741 [Pocillopora damicornis]
MARNLSTLRAITPKKEAAEKRIPMKINASKTIFKGCASKPTARSDTARLRRSVLRVFGNDEVVVTALIVTQLNMMAVMDKKELKTQLAMNHEYNLTYSFPVGQDSNSSRQRGFFMIIRMFLFWVSLI